MSSVMPGTSESDLTVTQDSDGILGLFRGHSKNLPEYWLWTMRPHRVLKKGGLYGWQPEPGEGDR